MLKQERSYNLYVYNDLKDITQVNHFYQTKSETEQDLKELRKQGTWLYRLYANKFKFYAITNSLKEGTIQEKITKVNHSGCIAKGLIL